MTETMKQIRDIVETKNISQVELATKVNASIASVSRWLKGTRDPKISDVEKLVDALGMKIIICNKDEDQLYAQQMYSLKTIKRMLWTLFEALNDICNDKKNA